MLMAGQRTWAYAGGVAGRAHLHCKGGWVRMAGFRASAATTPVGMSVAGGVCGLPVQWMYPSRTAPGGPAVPPCDGGAAMRRRTISIAEQQQRHCNLGRAIKVGGVTGGVAADDGAPAGQRTVVAGLHL